MLLSEFTLQIAALVSVSIMSYLYIMHTALMHTRNITKIIYVQVKLVKKVGTGKAENRPKTFMSCSKHVISVCIITGAMHSF